MGRDRSVLVDEIGDLVFAFDEQDTLVEWNAAVPERTGRSEAALSGLSLTDCFADCDAERVASAVATARETGTATVTAAVGGPDGAAHYEFRFDRTSAEAVVAVGRETTPCETGADRHRHLERMSDGYLVLDEDWVLTRINDAAGRIVARAAGLNAEPAELVGEGLWDLLPEAVGTPFYERYHEAVETGNPVSFEEYYPPLEKWFDVRAYPAEQGLSVYFHDITERREYQETLEHRQAVLREMHTIVADRGRSFTEQVEALLALGRSELGTEYGSLSKIDGEDYLFEVVDADDDSIQAGDVVPLSATNCEVAASTKERLVLADVARDAPGETDRAGYVEWGIACYLGGPVFVDDDVYGTFCFYGTEPRAEGFSEWEVTLVDLMTDWVSYELQRRETERRLRRQNDRLDRFASVVSHDLRNPLNVVAMGLETAEETGDPEAFARCNRALDRMETLVDDLLRLARAGESIGELTDVSIDAAAEDCWATVETGDATLRVETDQRIRADPSRFQQLLENLVRNAVEHGSTGSQNGSRSGDAVEQDDGGVTVTVGPLENGFYVADDGPGIEPDERHRIFDAGYTTADDGTGMGLSIVEEIVDAHGWDVSVTESADGGVRFEFTGITESASVDA